MLSRVRRCAATAVLLVAVPLGLPSAPAEAALVETCNPAPKTASSLCVSYDFEVLAAGTETPTTQSLAPIDVRVSFANTSTNYLTEPNQPRWLNRVSATLLSSDTIRPVVTGTADLPDKLIVGGSAAGCDAGPDFSFSGCDAGHGVAYVKLSGVLYNGIFKATFGIERIYSDQANLGSHFVALTADVSICADTNGGSMSCNQSLEQSSTITLDQPPAGEPLTFDFTLPPPEVPLHTVQAIAADSATLHLLGQSDQLLTGPAGATHTVVALPEECGTVSGAGTAFAKDGGSVTAEESFTITGCTTLTATAAKRTLLFGTGTTIGGTLVDDAAAPLPGETIKLRSCPTGGACSTRSTTTAANGGYGFTVKPSKNTAYQISHTPSFRSASTTIKVMPKITLTASRTTMPSGGTVKLTGKVAPAHDGRTVKIQRLVAGEWKTIASATLSSTSTYAKQVTLTGRRGSTAKLRVVLPAHADHAQGKSPSVGIRFS